MIIAVSACLLGERCRYDGASCPNAQVIALAQHHTLVPVCPECMGGLPTPRVPCEIQPGQPLRVINKDGQDKTAEYQKGAQVALDLAKDNNCTMAILKAKSPSCGSGVVYDGSFVGRLTSGWGVAAQAFRDAGIPVITENDCANLED